MTSKENKAFNIGLRMAEKIIDDSYFCDEIKNDPTLFKEEFYCIEEKLTKRAGGPTDFKSEEECRAYETGLQEILEEYLDDNFSSEEEPQGNPPMSRAYFVLIAEALRETKDLPWRSTVLELADRLRSTNPQFDRQRFLKAAGVEF